MNIKKTAQRVHARAKSKGWWDEELHEGGRTFGDLCALLHSEVSEAYEDYRDGHGLNEVYYEEDGKPCGIPIEFADIMIRLLDNCEKLGIDIESAITTKDVYNAMRSYRHGGKKT